MVTGIVVAAGVVVFALIVWTGTRTLRSGESLSTTGNAFGPIAAVFDPARERAEYELEEREHAGSVIPSTAGDDRPLSVDLARGTATVRRPRRM